MRERDPSFSRLSLASLAASVLLPVRRSGDSWDRTNPSRPGRNRSEVSVCACARVGLAAMSARQAERARKALARLWRPGAGPDITTELLQQSHTLEHRVPASAGNVVNGVKTFVVNEQLTAAARVASRQASCYEGPAAQI